MGKSLGRWHRWAHVARLRRRRTHELVTRLGVVSPRSPSFLRGPELPDGYEWPDATLAWWQHWRESPQAQFIETDWSFLLDTALIHAEFWRGYLSRGAELRLRVAKFGATAEDRRRLKLAVGEPAGPPKPRPSARRIANRRAKLLRAVDNDNG